jgi:Na+/melibiose symporter-like transporter
MMTKRGRLLEIAAVDPAKLGWVTGELAASYAAISSIYLLFYATEVLHLPPAWAGLALLVPRAWNVVADPIVGYVSDRTHTRFGRRRPFLLGGALAWAAAFFLLFNLPQVGGPFALVVLFSLVFLLNNTGLSVYQVPYHAMLAELTRDPRERTTLVAYREIVARIAVLLTMFGAPLVLAAAADRAAGFHAVGLVFGGAILGSGLIAFFATARAPATEAGDRHPRMKLGIAPLIENRPFAFVTLSFLFVNLGDAVFSGSLVYYLTEVLGRSPAWMGILYPVSSLAGILGAPLWTIAANRYGKAAMCRLALGMNCVCCALPLLLPPQHDWLMYPFMALYGLCNSGARMLPCAMVPDTVEVDQRRTGQRREGVIFGLFVFAQQTGFAAGGFILSLLLTFAGVGGVAHGPGRVTGIVVAFAVGSAVLYGAAFLAALGYRLDPTGADSNRGQPATQLS